jgi:hypothetical protein
MTCHKDPSTACHGGAGNVNLHNATRIFKLHQILVSDRFGYFIPKRKVPLFIIRLL